MTIVLVLLVIFVGGVWLAIKVLNTTSNSLLEKWAFSDSTNTVKVMSFLLWTVTATILNIMIISVGWLFFLGVKSMIKDQIDDLTNGK